MKKSSTKRRGGKGILSFFLGLIMGVVIFVGAIAGTIYAVVSVFSVGQVIEAGGKDPDSIFDEDSDITNITLLELAKMLYGDVPNIGNMSLNELSQKYGVSNKLQDIDIAGIDFSSIYDLPINEISDGIYDVLMNITFNNVGHIAGIDFEEYDIPIIMDNLNIPMRDALKIILETLSDDLTLRQIEDNFGITFGDGEVFDNIKDTPLSQLSNVIDGLPISSVVDVDTDNFVALGQNQAYVKTGRYEVVAPEEYDLINKDALLYVCSGEDGSLLERELRFVQKTIVGEDGNKQVVTDELGNPVYIVDNSCYDTPDKDKVYYRYFEYEPYTTSMGVVDDLYIKTYGNHFEINDYNYTPAENGFVAIKDLYVDETGTTLALDGTMVDVIYDLYIKENDTIVLAQHYGVDPYIHTTDDTTLLNEDFDGYALVHKGTSDKTIQLISYLSIGDLSTAKETMQGLTLGDLIEVNEDSAQIVKIMEHRRLDELSGAIEDLLLCELVEITPSLYTEDPNGKFVFVTLPTDRYVEYDETIHAGKDRYVEYYEASEDGRYVFFEGEYYYYNEKNEQLQGLEKLARLYKPATGTEPADTKFFAHDKGGYYTLYHPSYGNVTRYTRQTAEGFNDRFDDFLPATDLEISMDAIQKYYWDGTQMVEGVVADKTLYVVGTASSRALQRLASSRVADLDKDFDRLILADVMNIDPDLYEIADDTTDTSRKYYYEKNNIFFEASQDYIANHSDETFYIVSQTGTSHAVMKMLAYTPILKIGERMEDVIGELYIEDLIDIFEHNIIESASNNTGAGTYFTPYDKDYTEYVDGKEYNYAFIPNADGKYYLRDYDFVKLTDKQAELFTIDDQGLTFVKYGYYASATPTTIANATTTLQKILTTGNGFFKDEQGKYHHNPALCAYILTRYIETVSNGGSETPAGLESIYTVETTNASATPQLDLINYNSYKYNGAPMLYVNILGQYIPYDESVGFHSLLDKYLLVTDGYMLADENAPADRQLYYYDRTTSTFTTDSTNSIGLTFVKNSAKANDGTKDLYYYVALDSKFNEDVANGIAHTTYSKHLAETTYVKTTEQNATHMLIDGKVQDINTLTGNGANGIFLKEEIGCVFTIEDSSAVDSILAVLDPATIKINYIQQQSVAALRAFAKHDVKVGGLNNAVDNFTVSDMINIAPDTMFDDPELRGAKITELSTIFQGRIKNMTIKNILDWGNITTLDDDVFSIIGDATLEDFFASLSYDNGDIHVDIVILYINIYARQNRLN